MYYDYFLYYLSYWSSLYNGYPLMIRVTIVMIILLIGIVIFGLIRLLIVGFKIRQKRKMQLKTKAHFESKLNTILRDSTIYDSEEIRNILELNKTKTGRWRSEYTTDVLLAVKDAAEREGMLNEINFKNSLDALALMSFWEKRIRTASIEQRREALQIVGELHSEVSTGVLSKSTFHKDADLRKTARELYTSQDHYHPFKFMEESFDEEFTELDMLRLHSTLVKRSREEKLPNLLRWARSSKNPLYIMFVLKEIGFFKQYEASPKLLQMLDSYENAEIRARIVETLGSLDYYEAVEALIDRYPMETTVVRQAIIKAMGVLRGKESLDFLVENYSRTEDVNAKLLIAQSISNHGYEGEQALQEFQRKANYSKDNPENILLEQVISEKKI